MGGANEIVVCAHDEAVAQRAIEAAAREVKRIETKYSRYRAESVVGRINAGAGGTDFVACDAETNWLLDYAARLYEMSGGLFDATSGVLRRAWDFKAAIVPSEETLAPLLALVGWERVQRKDGGVRLAQAGMELDFGGYGKEYAADLAAQALVAQGISHGYVNLGGDISVVGPRPDGEAWLIGVPHPRKPGEIVATIPMSRGGLATSGDYEKYFDLDGKRYCHILNPHTGCPVGCWASVSVMAPSALLAGSHSTIAMLKARDALPFLRSAGCAYLLVDQHGHITHSGQPTASQEHETCRH